MQNTVEEVKNRLDIVDVVSQYVQLKKMGGNYKGLCPFHNEKTPSFVVSTEKQICHCFGCNKGGDIFSFIQELEGVSFPEALEILADRAGVKINVDKFRKKEEKNEKDIYFKANELAQSFFEDQLWDTAEGKKVLEYLYKRGLQDETIKEFHLGFAPDSFDSLYPYLLKKGITREVLLKSGFVSTKRLTADEIFDKYRARLMFPVFDYLGKIVGFGGRALMADQSPKYLNSPENIIYNKRKVLYGFYLAKQAVKEKGKIILVEGYFDVILPYQSGIKNIVATSGTALTEDQVRLIKRICSDVTSCFDSDGAGFEATKRAYFLLQDAGLLLKTVTGLQAKDPADFVVEEKGNFDELISQAPDFIDFFAEKLLAENDLNTLTGRRKIIKELVPCYYGMSPMERDFFVRKFSVKLNISEKYLYEEMENSKLAKDHPARFVDNSPAPIVSKIALEELTLALVLEYPYLFEKVSQLLKTSDLNEEMKSVYKALTDQYNSSRDNFGTWDFDSGFLAKVRIKIDVLRLYVEEKYAGFSQEALNLELGKLVDKMKKEREMLKRNGIINEMHVAEKDQDMEKVNKLKIELLELLNM